MLEKPEKKHHRGDRQADQQEGLWEDHGLKEVQLLEEDQ